MDSLVPSVMYSTCKWTEDILPITFLKYLELFLFLIRFYFYRKRFLTLIHRYSRTLEQGRPQQLDLTMGRPKLRGMNDTQCEIGSIYAHQKAKTSQILLHSNPERDTEAST